MGGTLLYLFWEAALLAAAARVAMTVVRAERSAAGFLALVLAADIAIAALAGQAIGLLRANSTAVYVAVAAALAAFGARRRVAAQLYACLRAAPAWMLSAAVPLVLVTFKPVDEWDSINYLHFLLEWHANHLTPYTFATNYVAFWECGFLPALALARTDSFLAVTALKAVLLLGLALWLVGEQLEIPLRPRLWTVAAALALQHLWGCHSGVGTLKPDALHAAGVALLAVAIVRAARREFHAAEAWLFAFGAAFAAVKYTGLILYVLAVAALVFLRVPARRWALSVALFAVTAGHYYARSLVLHGNPFYPFTVRVAGLELPGTADLSATSITSNLGDARVWKWLFWPAGGLSPGGLLFPAVLAGLLCATLWVAARGLRRRTPAFWMALWILAGWLLYFRTFWSAGPVVGDLGYLANDLSTLRYVEGFLALGELFLVWLLLRRGVPEWLVLVLVALHGGSRLWLVCSQPNLRLYPPALWIGVAVLAGVACARFPAPAVVAGGLALVCAAPALVERSRALWLPEWKPVYDPVRALPPSSIFYLEDPASGYHAIHFALAGPHLEHDVRYGTDPEAVGGARFAVRVLAAGQARSELAAFTERLARRGYRPVVEAERGVVLERVSHEAWSEGEPRAWYLEPDRIAAAGTAIATRTLRFGDTVFQPPRRILRLDAAETKILEPAEGAAIFLVNAGPPGAGGIRYRFRAGEWLPETRPVPPTGAPYVSIERGDFQIEQLRDDAGAFVRIHARNEAAWLIYVHNLAAMPEGAPFTFTAGMRCPPGVPCVLWIKTRAEFSDRAAAPDGAWHTLRLPRRARALAPGDHLAVGRRNVAAGDWFDVRDLGALEGSYP